MLWFAVVVGIVGLDRGGGIAYIEDAHGKPVCDLLDLLDCRLIRRMHLFDVYDLLDLFGVLEVFDLAFCIVAICT